MFSIHHCVARPQISPTPSGSRLTTPPYHSGLLPCSGLRKLFHRARVSTPLWNLWRKPKFGFLILTGLFILSGYQGWRRQEAPGGPRRPQETPGTAESAVVLCAGSSGHEEWHGTSCILAHFIHKLLWNRRWNYANKLNKKQMIEWVAASLSGNRFPVVSGWAKGPSLLKPVIETGARFSVFPILVKDCFYMTATLEI